MKNKSGIQSRVFITFSIFIILIVNISAYLLFFFVSKNLEGNTHKSIINEYETIKAFIDLQKTNIFSLPEYEIKKINNLGFFFYIGNNDKILKSKYKIGFSENNTDIIYRGDYKGYNIIIGKNIEEYKNLYKDIIEILIILNLILIISIFIVSYTITKITLKPLINLSKFLDNYKNDNKKTITNKYGDSEIGKLTKSINNFITENKKNIEYQKDFIQNINHELKTPLMQMDSNIELIEDKIEDTKIQKRINSIKDSIKNINEIISNIGFILRGEENTIKKEKINLYNYFNNLIETYKIIAHEKDIKINIEKKYNLEINNNKYYLDRLFGNIISNSIFYNNGNNYINIIINKTSIEIQDKGIGIEVKDINNIFNRFYRNPQSGIYYKNGNGLGLSIVKKICDIFGWNIKIDSKKGVGTKFKIEIKK